MVNLVLLKVLGTNGVYDIGAKAVAVKSLAASYATVCWALVIIFATMRQCHEVKYCCLL